ncbi:MAG: pilus assembly protein N-terminal domain-containing protein, partial [Candidatus Riflebacteria bacterium]|nr:pilus assembly protein N-terminal domain-containing protein [Candidatus Riflebacteria bacterium]
MGPKGPKLVLAVLVFLAAVTPLPAAPRTRKSRAPAVTVAAPSFMLAAAPEATGTAAPASPGTTRAARLPAPAPEAVPGALALDSATAGMTVSRLDTSRDRLPDVLRLYPNESKIIKVEGLKRVSITNQDVADVVIVSPEEILVLPNKAGAGGRTSAYFWDKDGRKELKLIVIGRIEESAIAEQIQKDINLSGVKIEYINGRILMRGKVRNPTEKAYAKDIAGLYGSQGILDLLEVEGISVDPKEALIKLLNLPDVKITVVNTALQASAAQLAPQPGQTPPSQEPAGASGLSVTPPLYVQSGSSAASVAGGSAGTIGGPNAGAGSTGSQGSTPGLPPGAPPATVMVLLEGTVDDEQDKARADEITRAFFAANDATGRLGAAVVINHIEVIEPVQVLVEGLLLELSRGNSKQFDFKWGTQTIAGLVPGAELQSNAAGTFDQMRFAETPVA